MTRHEVADCIESFLNATGGPWDWDDFIHATIDDPDLTAIQTRCAKLPEEFPPTEPNHYCSAEGFEVLREFVQDLRRN